MKVLAVSFSLDHGTSEPQLIVARSKDSAKRIVLKMNRAFPSCRFTLGDEVPATHHTHEVAAALSKGGSK